MRKFQIRLGMTVIATLATFELLTMSMLFANGEAE
jgi:hypothetical protein